MFLFNEITHSSRRNAVEVKTPDQGSKETIELSDVQTVYGKDIQYLRVSSKKDGVLGSGGYSRTLRNLLFLSPDGGEPTWLLPNNDSRIIQNRQLTTNIDKKPETDYFYFEVVSNNENVKIGISGPNGMNLKYIDSDIAKVIEHEYNSDTKRLGVLLQIGNELRYRVYDLSAFTTVSDKFVIKL
jgi:hypothetical protein